MGFRIVDEFARTLGRGKDLEALKRRFAEEGRQALARAAAGLERRGLKHWTFGDLPRTVRGAWAGQAVEGYPALVDEGDSVAIRVLSSQDDQERAMWGATARLLWLESESKGLLRRQASGAKKLGHGRWGSAEEIFDDCARAAIDELIRAGGGPVFEEARFDALRQQVVVGLAGRVSAALEEVAPITSAVRRIEGRISAGRPPGAGSPSGTSEALSDIAGQLGRLIHPGFVAGVGIGWLGDIGRYLQAIEVRLDKLAADPVRDRPRMAQVHRLQEQYDRLWTGVSTDGDLAAVGRVGWMIEELRVSLFAQAVGTTQKVSVERVQRAIDALATP
jgi:ATP-dependent helicase HrpA